MRSAGAALRRPYAEVLDVDQITGLGRPAQWLEDLRMDLLIES